MTNEWSIFLSQPHNRRFEDGSLVIWRPGFTLWIAIWNNDNSESIDERLESRKQTKSKDAFEEISQKTENTVTYSYRLNERREDGIVYAFYGFIFSKDSHVQIAAYFDLENEYTKAREIIDGIQYAPP